MGGPPDILATIELAKAIAVIPPWFFWIWVNHDALKRDVENAGYWALEATVPVFGWLFLALYYRKRNAEIE
ncbi:hypothetical protein [Haladaptatus sp. DFWS20]|uniref:hypothetical protein n=1 Tax=Haladaptatus sp. DFWS20 TaxID=3403467 RepID=UPI003EB86A0D